MDRAIQDDLQGGGQNAQSLVLDFLQRDPVVDSDELLAGALLRLGLIEHWRGLRSRQEVVDLVSFCSLVCPKHSWPRWTTIARKPIVRDAQKNASDLGSVYDPNAFFVLGPDRLAASRATIASGLATSVANVFVARRHSVRIMNAPLPMSTNQEIYLRVLATRSGGRCFAWIDSEEKANFAVYDSKFRDFLECRVPILQFPVTQVDWLRVERYFAEYNLLLSAHAKLAEGDYYGALHALEDLRTPVSSDSLVGVQACLIRGLAYLLLGQRDQYRETMNALEQWRGCRDVHFAEMLGKIGDAFLDDSADSKQLELLSQTIRQNVALLSSQQNLTVETLLGIVEARARLRRQDCLDLLRRMWEPAIFTEKWQRELYVYLFQWMRGRTQPLEDPNVVSSFEGTIDKAKASRCKDLILLTHLCGALLASEDQISKPHLDSLLEVAYSPDVHYLYPLLLRPLVRVINTRQHALSREDWDRLCSHILKENKHSKIFSTGDAGLTDVAPRMREIAALVDLKGRLGIHTEQTVDQLIAGMDLGSFSDLKGTWPLLYHLVISRWQGQQIIANQIDLLEKWAEGRVDRPEQSFEQHLQSGLTLEALAIGNLLIGKHDAVLKHTERAAQHIAVVKQGGVEYSAIVDLALAEQGMYATAVRGEMEAAEVYCQRAEAHLQRVLSYYWQRQDLDPSVLALGNAMIPSASKFMQTLVLRWLFGRGGRAGDYAERTTTMIRGSLRDVTDTANRYMSEQIGKENLAPELRSCPACRGNSTCGRVTVNDSTQRPPACQGCWSEH
jgi:hypothetical protein